MGKMKGDIYKYYMLKYDANDPANSNPRLPKWECRFCSKQYVQNATKMRHHVLNMCGEIPAPLKLALLDIPNVNVHEDSNDETKAYLSSLGIGPPSQETMILSSSSPASSSSAATSPVNVKVSVNRITSCKSKKVISKPPPKKRRALSLTPPASSSSHGHSHGHSHIHNHTFSHSSTHSHHQHQHPPKFSNLGTNLEMIASANNTLTALSAISGDQESLWVILARALYSSGTSLSIVENPYWLEVFQRISPGLNLPSKDLLAKDLLDKEVLKIQSEIEKQVAEAKYVSLQCEAWMNARGESMITFVVTTPTPFSYKTFPTGGTHHSDTIIADCTSSTIRDIEATLSPSINSSTKVLSVVTTTKPHMKSAWTKIHAMYPDLLTFGCIVEGLELFLESIVEQRQISEVLSVIRGVIIKIRRSPIVQSKFEQLQSQLGSGSSPSHSLEGGGGVGVGGRVRKLLRLPRNRYWYRSGSGSGSGSGSSSSSLSGHLSFLVSLQSLLNSEATLRWLAGDAESLEMIGEDLGLFSSDDFWLKIQILCKLLFPTIKWLNCMKEAGRSSTSSNSGSTMKGNSGGNNSNGSGSGSGNMSSSQYCRAEISNVPKAFVEIQQALEEHLRDSMWHDSVYVSLTKSLDCIKQDCLHSVHLAAHLLDPRDQGSSLNQDQVLQATEFIDNFAEIYDLDSSAVIGELSEFRMRSQFYSKPFLWKVTKKVQGSIWWTTMAPKTHLAQLAAAILNISPCTFSMDSVITEASFASSHSSCSSSATISASTSVLSTSSDAFRKDVLCTLSPATSSRESKLVYVAHNLRINCRGSGLGLGGGRRGTRAADLSEANDGNDGRLNSSNPAASCNNNDWNWSCLESIPSDLVSESESEFDEEFDGDENIIIGEQNHIQIQHQHQHQHHLQLQASSAEDPLKESYPDIKIVSTSVTEAEHDHNSYYPS